MVAPDTPRRCTAVPGAVYTRHGGATPFSAELGQGQVGTALGVAVPPDNQWRCPQGNTLLSPSQPVTTIGVAVHQARGGGAPVAAPQARFRLLRFTFFTTFATVLTLQVFHHHVQVC